MDEKIREALEQLDSALAGAVKFLTGLDDDDLTELGRLQ